MNYISPKERRAYKELALGHHKLRPESHLQNKEPNFMTNNLAKWSSTSALDKGLLLLRIYNFNKPTKHCN